jgi:NADH/NAD ratio-sensing transcriptional regulator Rex
VNLQLRLALYRAVVLHHPGDWIRSRDISEKTGIGSTQIRRDMMAFDGIGQRGAGYSTEILVHALDEALKGHWGSMRKEARRQSALLELILEEE